MLESAPHTNSVLQPSRTRVKLVYQSPDAKEGWAVATLDSGTHTAVGLLWRTREMSHGLALQQARDARSWFVVPAELAAAVLDTARRLQAEEHEALTRGYEEMAADTEREKEAFEWCEALIGDGFETR